jgi:hypothetical protein
MMSTGRRRGRGRGRRRRRRRRRRGRGRKRGLLRVAPSQAPAGLRRSPTASASTHTAACC